MKLEYTEKNRRQKSNTKKLEDPGRQTNVTSDQRAKIRQIKFLKKKHRRKQQLLESLQYALNATIH